MGLDTIYKRRSIRRFTSEPVSEMQELELLRAAMAAPSAHDRKPWRFIVIRERGTLDAIARAHPHAAMLREATLCIAVLGDPECNGEYWILDCSAATQNILLAATAMGLGSCWLGMHPREERKRAIRPILGLPESMEILSLVAIGHPAERKKARSRYDAGKVLRERWKIG